MKHISLSCGDISFEIVKLVLCHNELISQNNLELALDKSQSQGALGLNRLMAAFLIVKSLISNTILISVSLENVPRQN